jgi:Carboxypeptidase regulatory-like domain
MRRLLILLGIAGCLVISSPAFAQQGTADLRGRVVDQQGAALPGVTIVVKNEESGLFRESGSGPDGTFFMSAMIPGTYEISAELQGFRKYQARGIRLEVGRTASIEVKLEVGALVESVTVTGESPLVDTTSKEIGGNVRADEMADVPSFNRNFTSYLGMLPGVVATISTDSFGADSINANGQAIQNVNYTFDGSNNNDTFNGGNGGAQARIPVEAVQEFQLMTSQFDAEHGNASGGIVNAVSKQGTNQFRGNAFTFFQNDAFTVRDYFAVRENLDKPQTRQYQFGGVLGGPIVRDKAHFFVSYERLLFDNGVTVNVPARPEFNRTDFERTRVWNVLARFDHQLNASHTWGLRYLIDNSPQFNQFNSPPTWTASRTEDETDTDWTLVATLSSVIGATKVNTFRVSGTREDVTFGNPRYFDNQRQDLLPPTLDYLSFEDQQSPRHQRRLDVAYAMDDTFAWFIPGKGGDHDLKFGVQYIWASLLFQQQQNMNGTFNFNHDLPFDAANPRSYPDRLTIRVPAPLDSYMIGHFVSAFAQDKWRPTSRLSLSLGMRYDLEILPIHEFNNPNFASPDDYPVDRNNFSPRVGFSYSVDSAARSVVRGGFGVFFQRTPFTYLDEVIFSGVFSDSFTASFPRTAADPGPSRGQFPADPMLRNGPTVNRELLNALFPPGTIQRNAGQVFFDSPDRHLPYSRQYSIGYERQVGASLAVSADYIRSEQRELYMRKNLNPGLRVNTSRTGTIVYRDPTFVQVWENVNLGWGNYNGLQVQVDKRYSDRWQLRGSYTFSRGRGVVEAGVTDTVWSQLGDDLRLDMMEGPLSVDRPHILSIDGTWDVPRTKGLKFSGVVQYRSATPITLTDQNFDLDRNGILENEFLPPGTYSGAGPDSITIENKGGRRGARTDGYFITNLRAGYRFRLPSSRTVDAFVDVFNVTDHVNFANPTGDRRSANFLVRTGTITPTRTMQLNLKYSF